MLQRDTEIALHVSHEHLKAIAHAAELETDGDISAFITSAALRAATHAAVMDEIRKSLLHESYS
jgi:uncharacterized protein (DUF1778 family)